MEAVPPTPKVVPFPKRVYLNSLPAPLADLAGARVCGVGVNFWGCVLTAVVKLPLASDAASTTGKVVSARSLSEKYCAAYLNPHLCVARIFRGKPGSKRGSAKIAAGPPGPAILTKKPPRKVSGRLQDCVEPQNVMRQTHQCPLPFYFFFSA